MLALAFIHPWIGWWFRGTALKMSLLVSVFLLFFGLVFNVFTKLFEVFAETLNRMTSRENQYSGSQN